MWWKVYFWLIFGLSVIGVVFVYGNLERWSFAEWFEIITSVLALIGLYAYVYKKKVLTNTFWKVFF